MSVQKGTRSDSINLCATCSRSAIIKGAAESSEATFCHAIDRFMTIRVAECSSYIDKRQVDLRTMQETAWILITKRAGKDIGFLRNREFRKEYKEDVLPPGTDY